MEIRPSTLPNFFVVGAPKAGTTSLYNYLDQHPSIYMSPIKEPAFFAADLIERKRQLGIPEDDQLELRRFLDGPMTGRHSAVVSDWERYLTLFKNVRQQTAIGEASGNYLASSVAPTAIRERVPHARIVMILRDPVDRLFSQYSQAVARESVRAGFLPWVEEQLQQETARAPRLGAVWHGFYSRHLDRYLKAFAPPQVRIYRYEDYSAAPLAVLRDLFGFLDVDPDFPVDVSRHFNVSLRPRVVRLARMAAPVPAVLRNVLPRSLVDRLRHAARARPPAMTPAERARVLEIYEADIRELQLKLSLDVSAWLRV